MQSSGGGAPIPAAPGALRRSRRFLETAGGNPVGQADGNWDFRERFPDQFVARLQSLELSAKLRIFRQPGRQVRGLGIAEVVTVAARLHRFPQPLQAP